MPKFQAFLKYAYKMCLFFLGRRASRVRCAYFDIFLDFLDLPTLYVLNFFGAYKKRVYIQGSADITLSRPAAIVSHSILF